MQSPAIPFKHFKLTQLSYAIGLSFVSSIGLASSASTLSPISVVVYDSQQPFSTQTQSTVDSTQLKETGAQNMDDVVMYDPSVDVISDTMRAGHQGYNIRGIDNDRIQTSVDGIPLAPTFQDAGPGNRSTRLGTDVVEIETVKKVEIDKSGNSAIYGNGALGGSVGMGTYSPSDFVNEKKPVAAGLKYGYRSTYQSHSKTAFLAGYSSVAEGLLMFTQRDSKEAENFADNNKDGSQKTTSNKQMSKGDNLLAKVNFTHGNHRLEFTLEHYDRKVNTLRSDLIGSQSGTNPRTGIRVLKQSTNQNALDRFKRDRISAVYRYFPQSSWLDEVNVQGYSQKVRINDATNGLSKYRPSVGDTYDEQIITNNYFSHKTEGGRAELKSHFATGSVQHRFVGLLEIRQDSLRRLKGDTKNKTTYLADGSVSNAGSLPETYHAIFPKAKTTSYSLAVQDRMTFANQMGLNLALRYQRDRLKFTSSQQDTLSEKSQAAIKNGVTYRTLSPSIRFSVPITQTLSATAGYAYGKKLPDPQLVGVGIDRSSGGYIVIPNPSLKPEVANNLDAGLRYSGDTLETKLNVYYNQYKNFWIATNTPNPDRCPKCFDAFYSNSADKVIIYGAELFTTWKFAENWQLTNAVAWMKGFHAKTKAPLETTLPLNGVVGLAYTSNKWGGGVKFRWADKNRSRFKPEIDMRGRKIERFTAPGYGVWDLTTYYKPIRNLEIRAGVFNLFNKKYWTGADATNVQKGAADRYTQPGRNYSVNVELKF